MVRNMDPLLEKLPSFQLMEADMTQVLLRRPAVDFLVAGHGPLEKLATTVRLHRSFSLAMSKPNGFLPHDD